MWINLLRLVVELRWLQVSQKRMKNYSLLKGLKKALIAGVLFAVPFFVTNFPEVANLTIGATLNLGLNFLKVRYKLPL